MTAWRTARGRACFSVAGRILAPRGAKSSISRIDKDLKVELRETAFNMWMACYSQQEIAEAVGYSREAVKEFVNFLQDGRNGTDSENANSSENPQLASEADRRWFEAHPNERQRIREPFPGEFQAAVPPGHYVACVAVLQLAPGVRARQAILLEIGRTH